MAEPTNWWLRARRAEQRIEELEAELVALRAVTATRPHDQLRQAAEAVCDAWDAWQPDGKGPRMWEHMVALRAALAT